MDIYSWVLGLLSVNPIWKFDNLTKASTKNIYLDVCLKFVEVDFEVYPLGQTQSMDSLDFSVYLIRVDRPDTDIEKAIDLLCCRILLV